MGGASRRARGLGVVGLLFEVVHLHAQGGVQDRVLVFLWQVKLALLLEARAGVALTQDLEGRPMLSLPVLLSWGCGCAPALAAGPPPADGGGGWFSQCSRQKGARPRLLQEVPRVHASHFLLRKNKSDNKLFKYDEDIAAGQILTGRGAAMALHRRT